ncbi:31891_t:CDS:1, partial [Racocetra persica]
TVNLKDPVFQEEDFMLCKVLTSDTSNKGNNNIESNNDMNFDPK